MDKKTFDALKEILTAVSTTELAYDKAVELAVAQVEGWMDEYQKELDD